MTCDDARRRVTAAAAATVKRSKVLVDELLKVELLRVMPGDDDDVRTVVVMTRLTVFDVANDANEASTVCLTRRTDRRRFRRRRGGRR